MANPDVYKSSKSVNNSSSSRVGQYNASRNGTRAYTPPKSTNQSMLNKNKKMQQHNNAKNENDPDDPNNLNMKEQIKKQTAKKTLTSAAKAYNPVVGKAVEKALETKKGDEYLDEFAKAETTNEGVKRVVKKAKKETKQKTILLSVAAFLGPILIVGFIFIILFAKNADSQVYSNENDGQVIVSDNDDETSNVFKKYPKLYEKVETEYKKVADEFKVDIDRFLLIAALVAPLENDYITPVKANCGSSDGLCYMFKGKPYKWEDFLEVWAEQSGLLAKMQILSYIDTASSSIQVSCGSDKTMEQYAKNDLEVGSAKSFWSIFDIFNWFGGYRNEKEAELNASCIEARPGTSKVPDTYTISKSQGIYYTSVTGTDTFEYVKDPNTGGVFFWNLINQDGFIHEYFSDYLAHNDSLSEEENYKLNLPRITEIANYIYAYYNSIRRDCLGFPVMKGQLDKIKFREDGSSPIYTLDFEDVFVGGSVLATYGGARKEVALAQAVITRSEAYYNIVEAGADHITGSAIMGCWWWKYNPTYNPSYENQEDNPNYDPDYPKTHYPEIYEAVTNTRGIVVTEYGKYKVLDTEYDAFCPVTRDPVGDFYYLPDGQRNLPIDITRFSVPKSRTECPCFQNNSSQPGTQYAEKQSDLYPKYLGNPPQTTTEKCWTPTGTTKYDKETEKTLNGYKYHATGGHGRGVSQHGMAYFSQFGYNWQGLLKLFLERDNYGISFKRYEGSIKDGECVNYLVENRDE